MKYGKYNVDMCAAWLLATLMAKTYSGSLDTDKTIAYMKNSKALNRFTFNKALQKMRESYRIPNDIKVALQAMKK